MHNSLTVSHGVYLYADMADFFQSLFNIVSSLWICKKKSLQQSQNSFPPMLQIAFQVKELVLMLIKTDKMTDVLYKTTLYVNLPSKTIFFLEGGGAGAG